MSEPAGRRARPEEQGIPDPAADPATAYDQPERPRFQARAPAMALREVTGDLPWDEPGDDPWQEPWDKPTAWP